jgi:DNA-binding response OmpR family regulator
MNAPRSARLLVVDDDPTTRTLLEQVLAGDGHEVHAVCSGEDALRHFETALPDLVLLDVLMPGMDGFTTCERMRQIDQQLDVPIIMLTAADDYAAIDRAFAAQATDFIAKPFQWRLLLQRVRYALRTGRLTREVRLSRSRQATARRIARLIFFHWQIDEDELTWSDARLPVNGGALDLPPRLDALADVVYADDRARIDAAIRRTRVYGEPLDIELRVPHAGQELRLRLVGQVGDVGMDQRVISGALQDVTEQRRTEALAANAHTAPQPVTP